MTPDEEPEESQQDTSPVWCVAANVREDIPSGEGATETRRGTKKFYGGAKVYVAGAYWGMGAEDVIVVGRYRGKGYIICSLDTRYLINWRAELVYSPAVIKRLRKIPRWHSFHWDESPESKAKAEKEAGQFQKFPNG